MSYPHQSGRSRVAGIAGGLRAEKKTGQKPCTSRMQKRQVAGMCLSQTRFEINRSIEGV